MRSDLSTGKNLEVYVTMAVSGVLAVLGVVGTVSIPVLMAATLATLTLLAGSALGTRRHIDDLSQELRQRGSDQVPATNYLSADRPGLPAEVATAQEIRVMGVTLARTLRNLYSVLEERVAAGAHVRIVLIDPETTAPLEAARRSTVSDRPDMFENRVRPSIDLLRVLAAGSSAAGRVEVRLVPFVPAFGLVVLDGGGAAGRLYLDLYSHSSANGDAVLRLVPHRDEPWFGHYRAEFDRVWEHSRPVGPADGFPGRH
ncbi:hypothetical protein WN71_031905 [Streptomyces mangrovisoli]|uniref:Uncharacterized protein n=1 Tax=Streptomyces mangrovisoli TaxID=1428628 RepID=A0A1J4NNM3_9ACTN|nr:hypothetical protein WN71_031905 [Streptomyces mangrovisoli]